MITPMPQRSTSSVYPSPVSRVSRTSGAEKRKVKLITFTKKIINSK
jgi:hypothetical protein